MAYTDRFPIVNNFLETRLSADCDEGATTLYLENVEALPRILVGRDYIPLVLRDAGTVREIVYVESADKDSGTVAVLRGQENTIQSAWSTGTYAYCTVTADSFQRMRVNGFAPLATDEGRPSITRTSATTANITGDFTAQIEVGMAVRILSGETVVEPIDAELGAIHITSVSFSAGVTSVSFQNVSLPTKVDGLDLGLSVAAAPMYHPDMIVADEDSLTQTGNVLSVSEKFKGELKAEMDARDAAQDARDAAQDEAISAAQSSADAKVATVNGLTPDSNGNVDVGGMPLGTVFPYTGKDVPAGTLRADGSTYTNMRSSFPEFYEWVVNSGLTVALGSYTLVEGSCGYYGLDEATGTVRMPTLAEGVFGTTVAERYGQARQAGLPNITGMLGGGYRGYGNMTRGALYGSARYSTAPNDGVYSAEGDINLDASRSNPIYGRSDTVTPSHVKYPWVIVVYNAAVPPSVAQAGEFIEMLDKLATALPTGTVVSHAGNKDLNGYILCNGAAVSRTTYAKLFEAIGTTYGTGDGSTTFNLPNLTDKFIQGSGTAGTTKAAGLPEIYGVAGDGTSWNMFLNQEGAFYSTYANPGGGGASYSSDGTRKNLLFMASKYNAIYGASSTVQPPAVTMRYYIKY